MIPQSRPAKIVFIIVTSLACGLLILSIGATAWSQIGEDGWVSKAVIAFVSWIVTAPLVLIAATWAAINAVKNRNLKP